MPYKSEKIKIQQTQHDRRIKLTDQQKEEIKNKWRTGLATKRGLARDYKVSPRTIDFLLNPDKLEQNKKLRQERGGTKIYYDKNKHKDYMKATRRYKQELYKNNEIQLNDTQKVSEKDTETI